MPEANIGPISPSEDQGQPRLENEPSNRNIVKITDLEISGDIFTNDGSIDSTTCNSFIKYLSTHPEIDTVDINGRWILIGFEQPHVVKYLKDHNIRLINYNGMGIGFKEAGINIEYAKLGQ